MFTGLIETTGTVTEIRRRGRNLELVVRPDRLPFDVPVGASVSVDGACLTAEAVAGGRLVFAAVHETVSRTTLGQMTAGRKVNLERALRLGDRLEGHLVLGHVDGVGRIVADRDEDGSTLRSIAVPEALGRLMAEKGSVAVDGISLTIVEAGNSQISVALVPHTWRATTMAGKRPGDAVNLECDLLARYVQRLRETGTPGAPAPQAAADGASRLRALEGDEG